MLFQDGHNFFEVPHVIAGGEKGTGELPDVFGGNEGGFVGDHPVEDGEDDFTESRSWIRRVVLKTHTSCAYNALYGPIVHYTRTLYEVGYALAHYTRIKLPFRRLVRYNSP